MQAKAENPLLRLVDEYQVDVLLIGLHALGTGPKLSPVLQSECRQPQTTRTRQER